METIELLKQAMASPEDALAKAFIQSSSATSGLTYYDLEAPAKTLYPVLTPLRNETPRVSGKGGIQANWRAITDINVNNLEVGVSEGNRNGVIATDTKDYLAAYRGIGLEDSVTFEATYAGQGFDDVKARAVQGLLRSLMIGEEKVLLGGNATNALGTTPTPTVSASGSGAANTATAHSVICVALSAQGFLTGSVSGSGIRAAVTRTNADGSTDTYGGGAAQKSAAASVTPTSGQHVYASVANVPGASGYAWFWGTAGNEVLGAITTINSVDITTDAGTGTQTAASLPSADHSTNALVFDGLLAQCYKTGSNSYVAHMPTGTAGTGSTLTANSDGSIDEFDTALQHFWDNYRLSPDEILVSSQEMASIRAKVLGSNSSAQRFVFTSDQRGMTGGIVVNSYLNPFGMGGPTELAIKVHPNMPAGTVLFRTKQLPYPLSNVQNVVQVRTRQEYYQLEWPLKTRKYEYGVYADEVLQNYFPPAFGIIDNIAKG